MSLIIRFSIILIFFNFHINNVVKAIDSNKKLFCMYLTRSDERQGAGHFSVENIDEKYCTHLIYAYMGVDSTSGKIRSLRPILDFEENKGEGNIRKFNEKKHYNTNLKTLVAVGGWEPSETSRTYSDTFRLEENQNNFVKSVVEFISKHNFNGLALHWAYPGINGGTPAIDKNSYTSLLKKLKEELGKRNFILTVICQGLSSQIDLSYNVPEVSKYVDYIYLTSYDLYGEWSPHLGIGSGLYLHPRETDEGLSANSVVNNWISRGASPEKLILGVPLFGRTFTLKYQNQTEPGSFHGGPGRKTPQLQFAGLISYSELCEKFNTEQWTIKWEGTQKNPYAYYGDQWVGYENQRSLEIKSKYVFEKKLAGIAAAFIEDDDFRGVCGEKYVLLKLLNSYLQILGDSEFEYVINVSVFKKSLKNQFTQCIYHSSETIDLNPIN